MYTSHSHHINCILSNYGIYSAGKYNGGVPTANVTISSETSSPMHHCSLPIDISLNGDLFLENIALEIVTGDMSTANVTISSENC